MPAADIQGQEINYLVSGEGEAILFISGMTMNHMPWTIYQSEFFTDNKYQTIVFDNRDTGSSGISNVDAYTVSDLAQDTVGLLDHLEIERAHIIGYSLGGMVALEMAVTYPTRIQTLTALGSTARQQEAERNILTVVKSAKKNLSNEEFWKFMADKVMSWRFFENSEAVEKWLAFVTSDLNAQSVDALCRQADSCKDFDVSAALNSITCPTHVMVGAEDTMLPPRHSEFIANGIAGATYTVLKNVAHAAYSEAALDFNESTLRFIRAAAKS